MSTHVAEGDKVVDTILEYLHEGIFDNIIGELHVEGIFHEVEEGFAPAAQAAEFDVLCGGGDVAGVTVTSLLVDGNQIELHILKASGLNLRASVREQPGPIAVRGRNVRKYGAQSRVGLRHQKKDRRTLGSRCSHQTLIGAAPSPECGSVGTTLGNSWHS